jgi:hypothetical protein
MRSLLSGVVLLGLLAAGCKKDPAPAAAPPEPAAPARPAPAEAPAHAGPAPAAPNAPATPPPGTLAAEDAGSGGPDASVPAPAAKLPSPRWETLPGWIGFATVKPEAKVERFWTPAHPKAQVIAFSETWKGVPEGARVKLLSASGTQDGTYLGSSTEPYGCEGNTAEMAAFGADKPFPEGPVWVLPPDAQGAESVPVREVPRAELSADLLKRAGAAKAKDKDVRAFEVGGLTFVLAKTARLKGKLTLFHEGKAVTIEELGKGDMEGTDASPLDLSSPDEVGVPQVIAAFRFGADGPLAVVLGSRSYEGQNFWLATRSGGEVKMTRDEGEYLYFCAF